MKRTKASNNCASEPKNGTIQSFFNRTAKIKKRTVPCPICRKEVELNNINTHLDSRDCCKEDGIDDSSVIEPPICDSFENFQVKRKSTENQDSQKKFKTGDDKELRDDFFEDDVDDKFLAALKTPEKSSRKNESTPSKTIKLSPSVSYNPAQYKGIHTLSPSPDARVIKTGTKTARDKYVRTPTKQKRNLVTDFLPEMPQHDPFTPSKRSDPQYVPYYVTNFEYVLSCVIDCTGDKNLFSDEELDIIDSYRQLDLDSKKLFVRLLNRGEYFSTEWKTHGPISRCSEQKIIEIYKNVENFKLLFSAQKGFLPIFGEYSPIFIRKHNWLCAEKIRYEEVRNQEEALNILVTRGLLQDQDSLSDIEELLHLLSVNDIKNLAKDLNCSAKATSKGEIIPEILKLCRRKSGFFQTVNTLEQKLIKKAKALVSSCFKIRPDVRSTLMRVLCLWGLNTWWESKEDGGTPSTLTSILLTNRGRVQYPSYTIHRQGRIFVR